MADIFDVIADPTRRDLLKVLLDRYLSADSENGEISVGDIVETLGLSQPTVSKHLRVLRDHGLVSVREEGQHRYYTIDTQPLEDLEDWLIPFLSADFDSSTDAASSTVFAAWSGVNLPEPIKRAAGALQNPAPAGTAVGRAAAGAAVAVQDASHAVERRVIDPIKSALGRGTEK